MAIAVADVQRELNEIKGRVRGLERAVSDLSREETHGTSDATMERVMALTREIFPGEINIYEVEDPEIPGDRYHVLEVQTKGDPDEVLAQDDQWHRRLCQLPDRIPGRYRLCIVPATANCPPLRRDSTRFAQRAT